MKLETNERKCKEMLALSLNQLIFEMRNEKKKMSVTFYLLSNKTNLVDHFSNPVTRCRLLSCVNIKIRNRILEPLLLQAEFSATNNEFQISVLTSKNRK